LTRNFRLCAFADEADKALTGQIAALQANKIDQIELRGIDGTGVAKITPEKARETAAMLKDGGIHVWSIGSPIGKVSINSPRDDETDRFMRILDTAVICGAENIRLFSFFETEGDKKYLDEVVRRLEIMIDKAKGSGVRLCHENEKGIYGDIPERCAELHQALPELYGIFDPANYVQCGADTLKGWELVKDYIYYAHIKDARWDGHVVPPGTGDGNLLQLLKNFEEKKIEVLTLEPHLTVFDGLRDLEGGKRPDVGGELVFSSGREAFDYAVTSLRGLIEKM